MANASKNIDIDKEISEIREIMNGFPKSTNGKRYGISQELRVRIVRLGRVSGMKGFEFARAIGIGSNVLAKWQRLVPVKEVKPGFTRVRVKSDDGTPSGLLSDGRVAIEGPVGVKFSMSESQLVSLLRRLA